MAKIEFRIRRLESGDVLVAEFPDVGAAAAWLVERPSMVEVQRMLTSVDPEVEERLRNAMRPLDEQERARMSELEAEADAQRFAKMAQAQQQVAPVSNDPNRQMVLRWERAKGLFLADESDDREIPEIVREAVLSWVAERDTWVRERGEQVAAASLSVWPAEVPSGHESERIIPGGQFVTGTRPAAGNA